MRIVFKNRNNQIRSGWKILIVIAGYFIIQIAITVIIGVALAAIISANARGNITPQQVSGQISQFISYNPAFRILYQGIDFITLMLVAYLALRLFDKKKFRDVGFISINRGKRDLAIGLIIGAVSMTIIFVILLITGNLVFEGGSMEISYTPMIFIGLVIFILVGIKEEILTRGYCITVLNQMKRPWLSIILSSVIFSLLHIFNQNVRPLGLINIALVGILFGYMYLKSGNLWMPIGYHITWNYFQGDIFGFAVSGGAHSSLLNLKSVNDNILTGGSFGPEAGILATIVIALGMIYVWKAYERRIS